VTLSKFHTVITVINFTLLICAYVGKIINIKLISILYNQAT